MPRFVRVRESPNTPGERWVEDRAVVVEVIQGEQGLAGLKGDKGDTAVLRDDPDPMLTGDLKLNGFTIIGALEKQTLIIDGGLL